MSILKYLKHIDSIEAKEAKVKETLVSRPVVKKKILAEDNPKIVQSKKTYNNSNKGLKEYKVDKSAIAKTITDIYEIEGTIKGASTVKKFRESLKQAVNDDKLWRGADENAELKAIITNLKTDFNKLN